MIKRLMFLAIIAVIITLFTRTYVVEGIYVASASMEPTLPTNTHLFLNKIALWFSPPKRGDIVVFPSPMEKNRDLIKRVIALQGDKVEIKNKAVYLNDKKLREDYVKYTRKNERLDGDNLGPFTVPAEMAFMMGDNRDESGDSRDWVNTSNGEHIYFVPVEKIKGKILVYIK